MITYERTVELNICEDWLDGKGFCWGRGCGRRHPRWEGGRDLFRAVVCHKYLDNGRRCYRGNQCRHMHLNPANWVEVLTDIVGREDAAWDCAQDLEPPEPTRPDVLQDGIFANIPPEVQQDTLTRLLVTSPVLEAERVVLDMLRIVAPDQALERYFVGVLGHVRRR